MNVVANVYERFQFTLLTPTYHTSLMVMEFATIIATSYPLSPGGRGQGEGGEVSTTFGPQCKDAKKHIVSPT